MGAVADWFKKYSKDPAGAEAVVLKRTKGKSAKVLGKGQKGTAFDIGKRVLKLTTDKSEANAMAIVQSNPTPFVVRTYDVFKLGSKYAKGDVFGIVQDKLSSPAAGWAKFIDQVRPAILYKKPGYLTVKGVAEFYKKLMKERDDDEDYLPDFTDQRVQWLAGLAKFFDDTGIKFQDFHSGNLMKKGSKHVMIDLGLSKSPAAQIPLQEASPALIFIEEYLSCEDYAAKEYKHAALAYLMNPCAGTRYALEMAKAECGLLGFGTTARRSEAP